VRAGRLSIEALRAIVRDAHMLANDAAGFVVDEKAAEMADDFSLWQKPGDAGAPRVPARALRLATAEVGDRDRVVTPFPRLAMYDVDAAALLGWVLLCAGTQLAGSATRSTRDPRISFI